MADNFPLLLPVTMITFGIVFLSVWRWGKSRAALWWGVAYLLNGFAFACDGLLAIYPADWFSAFGDMVFFLSFLAYGQGLVEHLGWRWCLGWRVGLTVALSALCFWALLVRHDMALELAASDLGCALLLAIPIFVRGRPLTRTIDRALVGLNVFDIIDSLVRTATTHITAPSDVAHFLASDYAFFLHISATISGLVNAVLALSAVTLTVVAGYRDAATTDPLSGLLNRRGFEEAVARTPRGGSVISCDIDRFKSVNDRFGHAIGDRVIAILAECMGAQLPRDAIAARFGGEEFVIYLPVSGSRFAVSLANAIRHDFAGQPWENFNMERQVTASFGVSDVDPRDFSLHDAIARADAALYEAKEAGRNCTMTRNCAPGDPERPLIHLVASR
jgi:diguanylate cyclase (GGDEF)-like protein